MAAVATLVIVLFMLPTATVAASPSRVATAQPASDPSIAATVTWNGANILNYSSATSAARIGFNGVVDVHYEWHTPVGSAGVYTINDARLQIFYFGFALATRDVLDSSALPGTSGTFDMNWSTGSLQYILEGSYKLIASLLAPNGTTMWSQTFWAYVEAPFYVGAVLPIVLVLIVLWEVYNLATVGRQAGLGKRPPSTSTGSGPDETPAAPGDATAASTSESSPPASGGAS
jgi:hypothetical protein